jgi:hypothetical protein
MTDHFNVIPGDTWHVNFSPVDDDRIVHLCVGGTTIVLPALEAHKLGSALRAASGLDEESELSSSPSSALSCSVRSWQRRSYWGTTTPS